MSSGLQPAVKPVFENLNRYEAGCEPVFVARRPIFDRKRNVWGYELLFHDCANTPKAHIPERGVPTTRVAAAGFALAARGVPPERKLAVDCGAPSLREEDLPGGRRPGPGGHGRELG